MSKIYLIFSFLLLTACGDLSHLKTIRHVYNGNDLLIKQSYQGALDQYVSGLKYAPFSEAIHLNMGLAFEGLQQPDKALQSYAQAERGAQEAQIKFMALFNQAQLQGKAKKIDEALQLYQLALQINPASKEVKTNIELLIQDQQKSGGQGQDDKDQKDNKDNKDSKDNKDKKDNKDNKDNKDQKDNKDDSKDNKDKDKEKDKDKQYKNTPKYQPRKFDSKELNESDVKKILGELRQQEQKIRAEFNRKEVKEQPRDKDW